MNSVIDGLNWSSGRAPETPASEPTVGCRARELREQAESRIAAVVACQQPPANMPAPAVAFRELLRGRDVNGHESSGGENIAPYRPASDISMPDSVHDAPSVASLVAGADLYFGNVLEQMLRPDSERDARDEERSRIKPHVDPALRRHRRKFIAVLKRLVSSGLFFVCCQPRR